MFVLEEGMDTVMYDITAVFKLQVAFWNKCKLTTDIFKSI